MQTPSGINCKYFFGDYYRGKNYEECRLLGKQISKAEWSVKLCDTCPVPDILAANGCENMVLTAKVRKGFLGFSKRITVDAYCTKSKKSVDEPKIGCGQCHSLPDFFVVKE
jgi:hypothetical protein